MLLLLAAASIATAVDAERAFIADSHKIGQWTAFRKWAAPDAVMFAPKAVWAHEYLKDAKDPPKSIDWTPAESWVACDGRTAINRGPWTGASGKAHGYFTTVWRREKASWHWVYDGGDALADPMAGQTKAKVIRASCSNRTRIPAAYRTSVTATKHSGGATPGEAGQGGSADGTLIYEWKVAADGARTFKARLWNGRSYRNILDQNVAAPPK
jgi:hypothetical protein